MKRQWASMTAGKHIRETQLCCTVATLDRSDGCKHHHNSRAHWRFTQSGERVLFSRVSREGALYQLLLSVGAVISEAHRSILVLLREGAMEQQSLRTDTHTHIVWRPESSHIKYTWQRSLIYFCICICKYGRFFLLYISANKTSELNYIEMHQNETSASHLL